MAIQQEKAYKILSTKKLSSPQKTQLLNAHISVVEYNAIRIENIDFNIERTVQNAIITSKNAALAVLRKNIAIKNTYCVGDKTAAFLKENGFHVVEIAQNAVDLGQRILKKHNDMAFTFFCGNQKRAALPNLLKNHQISLREVEVYATKHNSKTIENTFDGILFFSPSAVTSYTLKNKIKDSMVFCIGATTASEAKKYTKNITIAHAPTIENVLAQVIQHKNTYD